MYKSCNSNFELADSNFHSLVTDDNAMYQILPELRYNEISNFVDGRYVSVPEEIWRLREYKMHDRSASSLTKSAKNYFW
jgi:hypothetical protein